MMAHPFDGMRERECPRAQSVPHRCRRFCEGHTHTHTDCSVGTFKAARRTMSTRSSDRTQSFSAFCLDFPMKVQHRICAKKWEL